MFKNGRYYAEDGKTFAFASSGEILGDPIELGINDSIENYIEIDYAPIVSEDDRAQPR